MTDPEVLIVDDEIQIRRMLEITLSSNGYKVLHAATAREGLIMAANHPPAMILLDLGLPDESGHTVLKKLREWYTQPIIILSVQSGEDDIIKALDNGANDYLVKPFRTGELLARIRSSLRASAGEEGEKPVLGSADLQIDLAKRLVLKKGEALKLTATEYNLLVLFAKNEGKVLTHQFVLRQVWGPGYIHQSQYLRVFMAQLRKKIEDNPNKPEFLLTESRVGYRFVAGE